MKREQAEIITMALEDVMHESFMPYAEYVILERALPRVEDGLKPVQRRILYSMNEKQIFPDGKDVKCARIVGDTMGNYHPHGDSSIYEALARMAQDFSMRNVLIDGHGNFGTIDGDSPAAMRYTEAKLAPLAMEMLRDIDKDTVDFTLNFDDTAKEPIVLPARFPNMLVNGATGIAVGIATNIPPHNLGEVIDGTVHRMKEPNCSLESVMKFIKAPDFPTGGILFDTEGLKQAYETGRGKILLRAKTEIETEKNGKQHIAITELPFEVREGAMLRKIDSLRETKKEMFAGIDEIRSETDRSGIRAVIDLKKGANAQKILDCLFKYSDLQISYGINIVAIAEGRPRQMGILEVLDSYIAHQRRVVKRRVNYDIEQLEEREHKLEGLVIAVLNLDLVIAIIRGSDDTRMAKQELMRQLDLTGVQAQTILDLRLARLTKLEIEVLRKEYEEVRAKLAELREIYASKAKLDGVIIGELLQIKKKYADKRRTQLSRESGEVTIDQNEFKTTEECTVILTRAGLLKRINKKSLAKMNLADAEVRNQPQMTVDTDTEGKLMVFTNMGNLYILSAEQIREAKFKDNGFMLSSIVAGVMKNEAIISIMPYQDNGNILFVTKKGMAKITEGSEFVVKKSKIAACGLKDGDSLILCEPVSAEERLFAMTKKAMSINIGKEELSLQGRTAKGVALIALDADDEIILAAQTANDGGIAMISDKGFAKYTALAEFPQQKRAGKGQKAFNFGKKGEMGSFLAYAGYMRRPCAFFVTMVSGNTQVLKSADIPTCGRNESGEQLINAMLGDTVKEAEMLQSI